jgi:hypothetical protein
MGTLFPLRTILNFAVAVKVKHNRFATIPTEKNKAKIYNPDVIVNCGFKYLQKRYLQKTLNYIFDKLKYFKLRQT